MEEPDKFIINQKEIKMSRKIPLLIIFIISATVNGFDFWGIFSSEFNIVKDGQPQADIVMSENAPESVNYAAKELKKYIKKISGADLEIRNAPGENMKFHIFVGESKFTKKLGFTLKDVKYDGFKIVSKDNHLILAGKDDIETTNFIPREHTSRAVRPRIRKEWQKYTGENWEFPSIVSFKSYNKDIKLSSHGKTGTLFAVYDFLETLGVRWYMPYKYGTVIPKLKTIAVKPVDIKKEPVFPVRNLFFCRFYMDAKGAAWYKRLKLGTSSDYYSSHSIHLVTKYQKKTHPEYFAMINGKLDLDGCKGYGRPRLGSPELFNAMVKYLNMVFKKYPEQKYFPVFPPDSFSKMDERDIKTGLRTEKRGFAGKMSDYVWGFVNNVAKEVEKTNPDKIITCGAYTTYFLPPEKIEKLNKNVGVTFCQTLVNDWNPEKRKERIRVRKEWKEKLSSGELYLWDYYLYHRAKEIPGVPVVFPHLIQKDVLAFKELGGKGEFIEANKGLDGKAAFPGLNHLNYYVNSKLYWNPELNMDDLLDEYYEKFYGPAKTEMKEFFSFAEEVWMRPKSRKISKVSGFMSQKDSKKYFEILKRAKAKAGKDTVYAKRIEMIIEECQPMKDIFAKLDRTGPRFTATGATSPKLDGVLDETFWKNGPFYKMKTLVKGRPPKVGAKVAFRWSWAQKGLLIAIECDEPEMKNIKANAVQRDSSDIFKDDVIEIYIETPQASYYKIVVNSKGMVYDECKAPEIGKGIDWNPNIKIAAKKHKDKWTLEIFLPLENIKGLLPSNAYPWGINICRTRMAGKNIEYSALSPTGKKTFFDLQKMGNLRVK